MTLKTINFRKKLNLDLQQDREVKIMILLLSVFVSSILFGVSLMNQNEQLFVNLYNSVNITQSFFDSLINSFFLNFLLLFFVFISGFSSIGIPSVIISVFIKGFSVGSYSLYFVSEYGLSGIGMYVLTVYPSNIIFVASLLICSDYSIIQSTDILSLIYNKNQNTVKIRRFLYKFIILSLITFAAAFIETSLTNIFGKIFI